ncbi:MAG: AMP-binding protein [Anaerolineales bacterium]|nr:AMP-binding protein [Anaerolineales bacterium]
MPTSVHQILKIQAKHAPKAPAILGLDRPPLSFNHLHQYVLSTVTLLNSYGLGRNDRIAIVIPNGPELALAFLAISSCATSAPLNPSYQAPEFEYYLSDLGAKAVIVHPEIDSPVKDVATSLGIPILELSTEENSAAGLFSLRGDRHITKVESGLASTEDVALVLHTSGTTSKPKIVPLSHRNLAASAASIQNALQLTRHDRCLNVMPLFHIHGLMAAILASMVAGASVVCTPGFYAPHFFDWLQAFRPSWYTAVPSMHQAVLTRAPDHHEVLGQIQLRFVRSSSASLPPQVMQALESTFNAPVIEAYGMTEASHQMTSNPLPPGDRKPGSVGIAAGPEVSIMQENGDQMLQQGELGEIVIRGASVTDGYANNPEENDDAFTDGWFRTGDQGYFDEDGYLFITGRLKEIINRGGEKISPREVDEVLMDHPYVTQAVTFAMPDEILGEDVAAAVVLRNDGPSELELRRYASIRLAYFKVPRRIVILDEIPKGPTGKLQRIGLAEELGLMEAQQPEEMKHTEYVAPRTPIEAHLAETWMQILRLERVGIFDTFLELGGDSLLATQLISRLRDTLDLELSLIDFFEAPTIAEQAQVIETMLLQEIDNTDNDEG